MRGANAAALQLSDIQGIPSAMDVDRNAIEVQTRAGGEIPSSKQHTLAVTVTQLAEKTSKKAGGGKNSRTTNAN